MRRGKRPRRGYRRSASMSKGEKQIQEVLLGKYGLGGFQSQVAKEIVTPFYRGTVFFDFHVPPRLFIEFDGGQHHKYTPHFHRTFGQFGKQCLRDQAKDWWCEHHGFDMIRVNSITEFRKQFREWQNGQKD